MYQKTITLVLFLLSTGLIQAQDYDKLSESVDQFFNKYIADDKPGAAVVVLKDGKVVHKNTYGLADYENKIPLSNQSVFDIASVSKQFAGYAVALLEKEGKLSLKDDVRTYIPEFPDFGHTITIGHLLHHQSGLRDWPSTMLLAGVQFDDVLTFEQILAMAYQQEALNFVPGTRYMYSNTGYNVMVEVIQRITQQPFREWTKEKIFQPLGMKNTFFKDQYNESIPNGVKSYYKESDKKYKETDELIRSTNGLTALGSSSLQTTIDDFALWLQYLDSEGAKEMVTKMQSTWPLKNEPSTYAYGVDVDTYKGLKQVSHSGNWASFNTYMAYFPDQHFSVAVFMNYENWATGFANAVTNLYLEDELQKNKENKGETWFYYEAPPSEKTSNLDLDLSPYTGIYHLEKYMSYLDITEEKGQLYVQATDEDRFPMQAISTTKFWVEAYSSYIYFNMDRSGQAESVTYHKSLCKRRASIPSKTAIDLSIYEGHYYSRELNTSYQVVSKDGQLHLSNLRNGQASLEQVWQDGFLSETTYAPRVDFQRNAKGEIVSLAVSQYRSRNQLFKKLD